MQTILNIFLGSSIVELKKEREAIKSMITDINSKLRKKEYFDIFICLWTKRFNIQRL